MEIAPALEVKKKKSEFIYYFYHWPDLSKILQISEPSAIPSEMKTGIAASVTS